MRIDSAPQAQAEAISSAKVQNVTSSPVEGSSPANSRNDTVSLSHVSGLVTAALAQPEVRTDKVEAIKSQIAAGTYVVDPHKIADAMIQSMQELVG